VLEEGARLEKLKGEWEYPLCSNHLELLQILIGGELHSLEKHTGSKFQMATVGSGKHLFVEMLLGIFIVLEIFKTEDRTLMTQERDIMTIKFRKIFSPNLFTENDSLILNHDSYTSAPDLVGNIAALSYISESVKGFPIGNLDEVNTKVAKSDLAKCLKAGHELYLFASDSVWQPDTKITKYYGLWRRLKKAYNELSMINNSDFSQEYIAKGNEGVKFAGVVRLGADNLDLGVSLVRENTGFQIYLSISSVHFGCVFWHLFLDKQILFLVLFHFHLIFQ
ncbi:hypothetical protein LCGC14_2701060, partial [marine sediment metagenome]